jgi:hypothetical protein
MYAFCFTTYYDLQHEENKYKIPPFSYSDLSSQY